MKRVLFAGLAMIMAIAGCVPSIHGIATEENTVWDENLLGAWGHPDETNDPNCEVWEFEADGQTGSYTLIHRDDEGRVAEFAVRLVQVGDLLFLDIFPASDRQLAKPNNLYQIHLLAAHTFMKVEALSEGFLGLRYMDQDAVRKLLEKDPGLVKHEMREDQVILTAGPEDLQDFLLQYADGIFGDDETSALAKLAGVTVRE
jgi:hypothetical protein